MTNYDTTALVTLEVTTEQHVSGLCLGNPDIVFNYVELIVYGFHVAMSHEREGRSLK